MSDVKVCTYQLSAALYSVTYRYSHLAVVQVIIVCCCVSKLSCELRSLVLLYYVRYNLNTWPV